jgi:hypothetical protein
MSKGHDVLHHGFVSSIPSDPAAATVGSRSVGFWGFLTIGRVGLLFGALRRIS